jgi:hypothetical protein
MSTPTTLERRLAIGVGIVILAAATDVAIRKAGGYGNDYARLLLALACGVFTGAYIVGRAWSMSRPIAIVILVTLGCGESYNLWQTAERVMNAREVGRAPARAALKQHEEAETALKTAEGAEVTSARLALALQAAAKAKAAYEKELREGGRCRTICNGLKADAEKAGKEVTAALSEAEGMKLAAIKIAKADLAAHPLPASGTASSDETGVPVWMLDLISAVLLSLGANGLAASLIAFGAHRSVAVENPEQSFAAIKSASLAVAEPSPLVAMFAGELPDNPTPPKGTRRKRQLPKGVIDFKTHPVVKALKANGGSVASHRQLAQLMGIDEGAATRRRHEVEDLLEICKVGKEMRIALKA